MEVGMAREPQLSTGDSTTKTWTPSAWKRKPSSTTAMEEETETSSHRAQFPATWRWLARCIFIDFSQWSSYRAVTMT